MSDNGISNYAYEIQNRKPHITLADYSDLEEAHYKELFEQYYESATRIYLTFSMFGTFINSGALFLSPNPTRELIELHFNHHNHFKQYSVFSNSLYYPERWIPHCTIANRLTNQKLLEALQYSTNRLEMIRAEVQEISFIKLLIQDNNNKRVETIFSKRLL
ncbi:2'-5' RNA ligase family protein [Paenibacillus sp. D2_2]|uniref:2'-5' RNA ligase family protein n=1 Tax=Paenibacillus sp. D2_2 TaxID=3073092 RepID=UPI002816934E|nr:2'-5' RNA ligase family protein [Paenibacillus sp. D2_2]WMT39721.1 2'-5' RNA ligase family protein [Paenibacillus sp. D2_2]